jgi:hypothetical protein
MLMGEETNLLEYFQVKKGQVEVPMQGGNITEEVDIAVTSPHSFLRQEARFSSSDS